VQRAKVAIITAFPAPWRRPQVSNTIGEKSTNIRPKDSSPSRLFCYPLSLSKVVALPRRGVLRPCVKILYGSPLFCVI